MSTPPAWLAVARTEAVAPSLPEDGDWLSPQERERLAALGHAARRRQFLGARWILRQLLSRVCGGVVRDWRLSAAADAPPRVHGRPDLYVSLSHSGDWVAAALAQVPVGIDVEAPRRARDIPGLVTLCCAPAEQRRFDGLEDGARDALFHTLWTAKESWLKRRGEGIAPARLVQLETAPAVQGDVHCWRTEGAWLALCVDAPPRCELPQWQAAGSLRITDRAGG